MDKNKKIITTIGVLIAVLVLFFIVKNISIAPTLETTSENNLATSSTGQIKIEPNTLEQNLSPSSNLKEDAWAVFSEYLEYNKNLDIEGVKNSVYKIASVCNDPKTLSDCEGRMSAAYQYGSIFKKENFTNVWGDQKQVILSTDFKVEEDDASIARTRSIIFFVRDENKSLKLLSFSPSKGAVLAKASSTKEEILSKLNTYTLDSDQDGISNYDEQCISMPTSCVKTDPQKRDTDGDGLWDSIESLINSMK